jgi:TusA-related sulfurtransferase
MKADAILDTLGLYCPMPIVKTAEKINDIKIGQVLEVISDDEGIKEDMPAWCKRTGNEFLRTEEREGEYRVYVKKLK